MVGAGAPQFGVSIPRIFMDARVAIPRKHGRFRFIFVWGTLVMVDIDSQWFQMVNGKYWMILFG